MICELSDEEIDLLISGLQMRACFIETGNPILRQVDAQNMGQSIRALEKSQVQLISKIDTLIGELMSSKNT